jgi:phenylalanine-4-hydroxylase
MLSTVPIGLTTNAAPFIEQARNHGDIFIPQPYELYSEENHETWRRLFSRMKPRWEKYANARFMEGVSKLALNPNAMPRLDDVNKFLAPLSGFSAKAVSGYVPAYIFFDCLNQRAFPTTITIRDGKQLDYLPEPDIFHDIAGHVPMHTDRKFADVLVRFGQFAREAASHVQGISDEHEQLVRMESILRALARFFWFTIEFGLMRQGKEVRVYGSGLLSSYGEIAHSVDSPQVQRYPIQLEWVINQAFEIDRYQPLLFIADSFEHVFEMVDTLEVWMKDGRLDNVAPGSPEVNEADLKSFLNASVQRGEPAMSH